MLLIQHFVMLIACRVKFSADEVVKYFASEMACSFVWTDKVSSGMFGI